MNSESHKHQLPCFFYQALPLNESPIDEQSGANADALSHEEYLNAPGQKVSSKFTTPGTYSYCESFLTDL